MKIDEYTVFLCDDGTMDTVVDIQHPQRYNGESQETRYDCATAAEYRDESGALDLEEFVRNVVIPDLEASDGWDD